MDLLEVIFYHDYEFLYSVPAVAQVDVPVVSIASSTFSS